MFHRCSLLLLLSWQLLVLLIGSSPSITPCFGFTTTTTTTTTKTPKTTTAPPRNVPMRSSSSSSPSALMLSLESMGVTTAAATATAGVVVGIVGGLWLYIESAPTRVVQRQRQQQSKEDVARYQQLADERKRRASIEPQEFWTTDQLKDYDGSRDDANGPILLAADGVVFNVYKGRNFYAPGGEYHIFAGRDATRLLARTLTEEESEEDAKKPLTMSERVALAGWVWTFKNKYDIVGKLEGFDEKTTSMKL